MKLATDGDKKVATKGNVAILTKCSGFDALDLQSGSGTPISSKEPNDDQTHRMFRGFGLRLLA